MIIVLKVTPAEAEQLYFGINRGELESELIVEAKIRELERDVQWAPALAGEKDVRKSRSGRLPQTHERPVGTAGDKRHPIEISKYFRFKPIIARIFGLALLFIVAPVIFLLVLVIRVTSRGPGIFGQTPIGKHGKHFRMYKLRTMYCDAESASGPAWCKLGDSRVTPVGRIPHFAFGRFTNPDKCGLWRHGLGWATA